MHLKDPGQVYNFVPNTPFRNVASKDPGQVYNFVPHEVELEMCLRSQVAYVVNLEVMLEVSLEACLMWSS